MNQQHPTSIQWQMLLDITEPVFLSPLIKENNFNMGAARSYSKYVCDTVLCVGGWAAIAFGIKNFESKYDYLDGATEIAKLLGFQSRHELTDWARFDVDKWGNPHALDMFIHNRAYNYAKTIKDVWHHWEGVRDRTIEWEEKNL